MTFQRRFLPGNHKWDRSQDNRKKSVLTLLRQSFRKKAESMLNGPSDNRTEDIECPEIARRIADVWDLGVGSEHRSYCQRQSLCQQKKFRLRESLQNQIGTLHAGAIMHVPCTCSINELCNALQVYGHAILLWLTKPNMLEEGKRVQGIPHLATMSDGQFDRRCPSVS